MKKTALSLTLLLLAFLAVDRLGALGMAWATARTQDPAAVKLRHLARDTRAELLLLGTSRCMRHYVPAILADSTGMTVYNGGIDGSNNIFAQYMALHLVLAHHTPRVVCLEVSEMDYAARPDAAATTAFFAPYIGRSPQVDSLFRRLGTYVPYRLSRLSRYNARAVATLARLPFRRQAAATSSCPSAAPAAAPPGETDDPARGYVAVPGDGHRPAALERETPPRRISARKLQVLEHFIRDCRSRHITLVMTISPAYSRVDTAFYAPLRQVAQKHRVPLLDYHTRALFLSRPDLFFDNAHLNARGAEAYTPLFARDLKALLGLRKKDRGAVADRFSASGKKHRGAVTDRFSASGKKDRGAVTDRFSASGKNTAAHCP